MTEAALEDSPSERFLTRLQRALALPYLGILRVVSFERPVVTGTSFTGGTMKAELFVVELQSGHVIASTALSAGPGAQVSFSYREGNSQQAAAAHSIESAVWSTLRKEVHRSLEQLVGARLSVR
jgi:hypothetical protein